ncbi:MAG TPA: hypothetical protein PK239_11520 [Chitinophagales bacterium]|nr:hypothetical protein [Chitinophagales bacterium]HRK27898.1 hypothetical protein [Chitinophagales bacterium]
MQNTQIAATFRKLNLIYATLVVGQVIMFSVLYGLKQENASNHAILQLPAAMLSITAILLAPAFYLRILKSRFQAPDAPARSLEEKIQIYQSANIVKLALLEGAAMFCAVCLMVTGEQFYAWLFIATFFSFMLHRPTPVKCAADLQLSETEKAELQDSLR